MLCFVQTESCNFVLRAQTKSRSPIGGLFFCFTYYIDLKLYKIAEQSCTRFAFAPGCRFCCSFPQTKVRNVLQGEPKNKDHHSMVFIFFFSLRDLILRSQWLTVSVNSFSRRLRLEKVNPAGQGLAWRMVYS